MKKHVYRKPRMYKTIFSPNYCTNPCEEVMSVQFNEECFLKDVFEDLNSNDSYDGYYRDEQIAHYDEIPNNIYMTDEDHGRYYNNNTFQNIAIMGMNYYRTSKYSTKTRLLKLYGVEATDGNVYYFTSMPSLTNTKLQS
jgi:hypothetical protein